MTQIRTKYQLPSVAPIPGIKFDVEKLRQEVARLNEEWVNVYQANRGLCAVHEDLASDNYHHFDQINLTYYEQSLNDVLDLTELRNECKITANSESLGKSKTQKYRTKIRRMEGLPAPMNEHNWYHPLPIYQGSYLKEAIEGQFNSTPIRVRLSRIRAGKYLTPHIDYGPDYAVRINVPIQGTEGVYNKVWRRGVEEEYQMPSDGSAYFLNVGLKHSVEHRGEQDRIALMFSLPTQEDIATLETVQ